MRWSRLKCLVEDLFVPGLRVCLHCTGIRGEARKDTRSPVARGVFQVRFGREVIWDYPAHFVDDKGDGDEHSASDLTALLREYVDLPKAELLDREFPTDRHGLVDLLRLADRRIGLRRLRDRFEKDERPFIRRMLAARCDTSPPSD